MNTPIADQLQAVAERCDGYDYTIIMRAREQLAAVTAERDALRSIQRKDKHLTRADIDTLPNTEVSHDD